MPRAKVVGNASLHAEKVLHLPAGSERDDRDAMLRDNGGPSSCKENLSPEEIRDFVYGYRYGIIDNTIGDWCYGYVVVNDARARWEKTFGARIKLDEVWRRDSSAN